MGGKELEDYSKTIQTFLAQDPRGESGGKELVFDCPLDIHQSGDCGDGLSHFFIDRFTGLWNCKHCDASGNLWKLFEVVYNQAVQQTSLDHYKELSSARSIHWKWFRLAGWAYQQSESRWLVPYFKRNKHGNTVIPTFGYFYWKSANLKNRFVIKKLSLPMTVYNPFVFDDLSNFDTVYLAEGEWDTLAFIQMVGNSEFVLGKPGSGLDVECLQKYSGKKFVMLFDNDASGRQQTESAYRKLRDFVGKGNLYFLDWSLVKDAPNDIRDFLKSKRPLPQLKSAIRVYESASADSVTLEGSVYDTVEPVTGFRDYISGLKEYLVVSKETEQAMAACIAATQSLRLQGEPLWLFLKGPASSGKTSFIESFGRDNEDFHSISKLTPKSLITGAKLEGKWGVQQWEGKTLLVKDFTTTCMGSPEQLRETFGLLTDIFDGRSSFVWGNGKVLQLDRIRFNIIAGVTDIIHAHSAASIGERFLKVDYLGKDYNPLDYAESTFKNLDKADEIKEKASKLTLGFIKHLKTLPVPDLEERYKSKLIRLAVFAAQVRTKVETDRDHTIIYKPRAELPPRLTIAFTKLFRCLQLVYRSSYEKELADKKAYATVKKVALDTCSGYALDIVEAIHKNKRMSRKELVDFTGIQPVRAHRILVELCTTGVLVRSRTEAYKRGSPEWVYRVNPTIFPSLIFGSSSNGVP